MAKYTTMVPATLAAFALSASLPLAWAENQIRKPEALSDP